jgi:hypothetical protein
MRTELMSTMNIEDQPLEVQWEHLLGQLEELLGKRPADLNGVLFLIGVQELGQGRSDLPRNRSRTLCI